MNSKHLLFLALTGFAGIAASTTVSFDDDLMQNIEDTNKSLVSNIALQDVKGAGVDAKELADMFAKVEAFYVKKGDADEAVSLARKSKELSLAVGQDVTARKFDHANEISTSLSKTCKTCHSIYKKDT